MPSSLERNGTPGGGIPGVFFVSKVLPLRSITGSDQEPGDREITVTDNQTNGIGRRRSISSMATPTIRTSTTTESGRSAPSAEGVAMKDSRRWSDLLVTEPIALIPQRGEQTKPCLPHPMEKHRSDQHAGHDHVPAAGSVLFHPGDDAV